MTRRWKYTVAKQWGGDDGYQWAIFRKGERTPVVCGLTRGEVPYHRSKIEELEARRHGAK